MVEIHLSWSFDFRQSRLCIPYHFIPVEDRLLAKLPLRRLRPLLVYSWMEMLGTKCKMRASSLHGRSIQGNLCSLSTADGFWWWSHCFAHECLHHSKLLLLKLSGHPDNNCNLDDSLVVWPTEATRVNELHPVQKPRHHCGGCKNIPLKQAAFWHQN